MGVSSGILQSGCQVDMLIHVSCFGGSSVSFSTLNTSTAEQPHTAVRIVNFYSEDILVDVSDDKSVYRWMHLDA